MKAFARAFRNHTTSFIFPNVQFVCLCWRADERGCLAWGTGGGGGLQVRAVFPAKGKFLVLVMCVCVCATVWVLATFKVNFHCEATQASHIVPHTIYHISYVYVAIHTSIYHIYMPYLHIHMCSTSIRISTFEIFQFLFYVILH